MSEPTSYQKSSVKREENLAETPPPIDLASFFSELEPCEGLGAGSLAPASPAEPPSSKLAWLTELKRRLPPPLDFSPAYEECRRLLDERIAVLCQVYDDLGAAYVLGEIESLSEEAAALERALGAAQSALIAQIEPLRRAEIIAECRAAEALAYDAILHGEIKIEEGAP